MKKAFLFLNGEPPAAQELSAVCAQCAAQNAAVYCTDGAYRYLRGVLSPDVVLGDFDSLSRDEVTGCEVLAYAPEKDYTDGFLAMRVLHERGFDCVDVYGAYGGRVDMAESNYFMLAYATRVGMKARFCGEMYTYLTGETFTADVKKGNTVSVVPFTDSVHILYTEGLKYALRDYTMYKYASVASPDYVMGVSNEGSGGQITVAIDAGLALVYIQQ